MTTPDISSEIARNLEEIKKQKGSIAIDDVSSLLEKFATVLSPGHSAAEMFLRDEITKIANHIQATKMEVLSLSTNTVPPVGHIATAAVQLDAVIKATEEAAHSIMDAADEIQNAVSTCSDSAVKQQIEEITGRIYEACNFQDLTGQRIKKVMQALDYTESRIQRLIKLFSSDGTIHPEDLARAAAAPDDLMNGPQLPDHAPSQADIDAMLSQIK